MKDYIVIEIYKDNGRETKRTVKKKSFVNLGEAITYGKTIEELKDNVTCEI